MAGVFAGVMSGTSLDGADAAVVEFLPGSQRTLGFASVSFPPSLRDRLRALSAPGEDSLDAAGTATVDLVALYAQAVEGALAAASPERLRIEAIGCHGQTVRHRPELGFTTQLNDPARLAELTGMTVVADFRRRDIAAGGQGAPLVPAFHDAAFRSRSCSRAIVNIGGIANISSLPVDAPFTGFDCGPGNVLLDAWTRRHLGADFDADGAWAARGTVDRRLLAKLLEDEFFRATPPKSTGRERFNAAWLDARLDAGAKPEDVQATLVELTARAVADGIDAFCPATEEIYLCGGGARNGVLEARVAANAKRRRVARTDVLGVPSGHVEAVAFAWLAMRCVRREPIDLTRTTGARGPRILGAIYPA